MSTHLVKTDRSRPSSPSPVSSSLRERLARDESGAVMVLGVFAAVLLVGMLYYVAGIGLTLLLRERTQDAADTLALAGSVNLARGMNLIVFFNLLMAALVTVLLALKVVSVLLVAALAILGGLSLFVPGAAAAIPAVHAAQRSVNTAHNAAKRAIDPTLRGLNKLSHASSALVPAAGLTAATWNVRRHYSDINFVGVPVPGRTTLPTEDDQFERLCQEAAGNLQDLATKALGDLDAVKKVVGKGVGKIARATSRYFCEKNGPPPSMSVDYKRALPASASSSQCEQDRLRGEIDSAACKSWRDEQQARLPDRYGSCGGRAACEANRMAARRACGPTSRATTHVWSGAEAVEELVMRGGQWRSAGVRYERVVTWNAERNPTAADAAEDPLEAESKLKPIPCQRGRRRYRGFTRYNAKGSVDTPVCSTRRDATEHLPRRQQEHTTRTIRYQVVRDVFGCSVDESQDVQLGDLAGDLGGARSGREDAMAPLRPIDGLELGSGTFQLRSLVRARTVNRLPENAQRVTLWNRQTQQPLYSKAMQELGTLGVAQSEYYPEGGGTADMWMWRMDWRARLVRFRVPSNDTRRPEAREQRASREWPMPLSVAGALGELNADRSVMGLSEWSAH